MPMKKAFGMPPPVQRNHLDNCLDMLEECIINGLEASRLEVVEGEFKYPAKKGVLGDVSYYAAFPEANGKRYLGFIFQQKDEFMVLLLEHVLGLIFTEPSLGNVPTLAGIIGTNIFGEISETLDKTTCFAEPTDEFRMPFTFLEPGQEDYDLMLSQGPRAAYVAEVGFPDEHVTGYIVVEFSCRYEVCRG